MDEQRLSTCVQSLKRLLLLPLPPPPPLQLLLMLAL
jgi:hypothetical protein